MHKYVKTFEQFFRMNEGVKDIHETLEGLSGDSSTPAKKQMYGFAAMVAGTHQKLLMGGSSEACGAMVERITEALAKHDVSGIDVSVEESNHNYSRFHETMTHWVSFEADSLFGDFAEDEWVKENESTIVGGIIMYCLFNDPAEKEEPKEDDDDEKESEPEPEPEHEKEPEDEPEPEPEPAPSHDDGDEPKNDRHGDV